MENSIRNLFPLTVVGTINATNLNGTLDCTMIGGGSDGDFCVDATGGAGFDADDYWNMSKEELGHNNLTKCGDNEILKVDGAEWNCEADATGGVPDTSDYFKNENFTNQLAGNFTDCHISTFNWYELASEIYPLKSIL